MYNPEYTDPYGTELYETDEERRRRLAAEAEANMPTKQTITYDNKTGAQKVKIEGSATNLSAMNPATPTVAGPVAPEDIYNRMIQAESGGRQFNAQGGVLTSPKGAMGVGQVMPSTAMQPGYGVTNIFDLAQQRGMPVAQRDEATARQLLGNEQLNREFGQNYYNAMQQRFPQDPNAAVAAYNAGPGRVGQNLQANAGQLNTAQLPNETQAYIQKVMGRMPQAQAQQTQPIINDQGQVVGQETPAQMVAGAQTNAPIAQGPVSPETQPQMVPTQAPAPQQPGPVGEQMGPSTAFMSQPGWIERFKSAQGDIGTMSSMLADPNLPKGAQMEIAASMADQMRFQKMEAEKREQYTRGIETGKFPREDRKTDGGGSWLRYFMYGLLGSPSAQIEKQRLMPELYAKPDYVTMPDGQTQAVIMRDDNGNAIRGTTADGRALTQQELIEASNLSATPKYKPEVSLQNVEKGDQKGRVVTIYDKKGNPKTVVESGGKQYTYDSSWKPESISTAAEKAVAQKKINLAYDPIIEAAKKGASFLAEVNAKHGTNFKIQGQENGQPVLVDGNTGQRVTGQAGGKIEATTTPAQLEAGQKRLEKKEEIIGKTEGESAASDIKNQRFADSTYGLIAPIAEQIKKSTGSGVGSAVDSLAATIGKSTDGAKAIQQLKILSYPILANVPRFEGPQSDYDVQVYKQAAGDFANDKLPVETRLAALQGMISLLKKYDKEGKNDWTFGGNAPGSASGANPAGQAAPGQPGGAPVIIKREKI
jgi:hypothetical protein